MTRETALRIFSQLQPEQKALLREIVFSGSPTAANEARTLLEVFQHFPEAEVEKPNAGPYDPKTAEIPY